MCLFYAVWNTAIELHATFSVIMYAGLKPARSAPKVRLENL